MLISVFISALLLTWSKGGSTATRGRPDVHISHLNFPRCCCAVMLSHLNELESINLTPSALTVANANSCPLRQQEDKSCTLRSYKAIGVSIDTGTERTQNRVVAC